MNYSLKAELDNCYSYADSLDNDGYGARQKTGLKTSFSLTCFSFLHICPAPTRQNLPWR